uniref:Uncharacterized protein n=1 Tax=Arundo donax TaxID=35708 RepID=A0A0A9GUF5_ARUDO
MICTVLLFVSSSHLFWKVHEQSAQF